MNLLKLVAISTFAFCVMLCSGAQAAEITRNDYDLCYGIWYRLGREKGDRKLCNYAVQTTSTDAKLRYRANPEMYKFYIDCEKIGYYACEAGVSNQAKLSFSDFKRLWE